MDNTTDTDHVHRVLNGDTGAFRHLVEKYQQMVFSLALKITGNKEEAEDAAQEIFLKCYRSLRSYNHRAAFATWLYRITYNHSIDKLKSKHRRTYQETSEDVLEQATGEHPDSVIDVKDVRAILRNAIDQLQPDEQVMVTLYYYDDLPLRDIADIMGIRENNAKIKLHRIRGKLMELLKSKKEITLS